ncbi:MAG: hypothetical protein HGA45_23945 [Chloroflexales bacterium]|nr:hypothetical protein [Chloroflexales bacterium]
MRSRRRTPLALALCLVLSTLVAGLVARAAPPLGSDIDPSFSVSFAKGTTIDALAVQPDGKILVGGRYYNGYSDYPILVRLAGDGTRDQSFEPVTTGLKIINALALLPDGKILVASDGASAILRLLPDGTRDNSFSGALGAGRFATDLAVLADGTVLVAGYVASTYTGFVARLDAAGNLDPAFTSLSANARIACLLPLADGTILIGGHFTSVAGQPRQYLARLLPDGALDPAFTLSAGNYVYTLAAEAGGTVLVGGAFQTLGGEPRNRLARLRADGTLDPGFNPGADGQIESLAVEPGGTILLGGVFRMVGGQTRYGLARLLPDGAVEPTLNDAGDAVSSVYVLAPLSGGAVLAAGSFEVDPLTFDPARILVRFYGTASPGTLGLSVAATQVDEGAGTVALTLRRTDGADQRVGAALRVAGGSATAADYSIPPLAGDPEGDGPRSLRQILVQPDGRLIVAGNFTMAGGRYAGRVARLNADGSYDPSFDAGAGADQMIEALALQADGKILLGGSFRTFDGRPRGFLARLNSNGSLDTGFAPQLNDRVWEIAPQADGKIIIAGVFTQVDGTERPEVARLNADGSLDQTFDAHLKVNGNIAALAIQPDGRVIIGGAFSRTGSATILYLSRLNADGSPDAGFSTTNNPNSNLREVVVQADGKILIVGLFTKVGSLGRRYMARLNADGTLDLGFDVGAALDGYPLDVVPLPDGGALIGGEFTHVGAAARGHLARLSASGALDAAYAPAADGVVWDLAAGPGGTALAAGDFTQISGVSRPNLARLNADGALDPGLDAGLQEGPVVVWAAGDTADKTLILEIIDDSLTEGDETIVLQLLPLGGAAGGQVALTLTIADNDGGGTLHAGGETCRIQKRFRKGGRVADGRCGTGRTHP